MNLADAFHALAVAGCRLTPGTAGGMNLEVPPGKVIDRQVLDALRAHRDELTALAPPPEQRGDLADYLAGKGITGGAAELVLAAAATFNVRTDRITIEAEPREPGPVFFKPGVPCLTTIESEWFEAGRGYFTIPAGTLAITIPQTWAIADDDERIGVKACLESIRRHGKPRHVPVWLAGKARALEASSITFEGAVAPDGMNLLPWRPHDPENTRP